MPKVDNRLVIYQKFTNLIYYSKNLLNKYPKSERFDLCSDIKNVLYKNLRNIIFAWKAYTNQEKLKYLRETDVDLIFLKSLITISYNHITNKYNCVKQGGVFHGKFFTANSP